MRNVIPGFALLLQIIVAGSMSPHIVEKFSMIQVTACDRIIYQIDLKDLSALGAVILTFLSVGILGFIFSNINYLIHWKLYYSKKSRLSYKSIVNKYPEFFGLEKSYLEGIKQREAWALINVKLKYNNEKFSDSYEELTGRLASILHSLGTTILIMIIGIPVGLLIIKKLSIIYLLANLLIIFIISWNYRLVAGMLHNLLERGFDAMKKWG